MANVRDYKKYYQENKEAHKIRQKRYLDKNKEKEVKRHAEYRIKNKEKIKEYSKKRYEQNREAILTRFKNGVYYKSQLKGENSQVGCKTKELWQNPEYRKKMSDAHKGQPAYWKGKKLPQEVRDKLSESRLKNPVRYWLNKKCPHFAGKNNPGYIHGKCLENRKQRNVMEYNKWRREVFKRDNFTCQFCGVRGAKLNADHIKPFAFFPELRHELSNGRTLCEPCHRKTDTYGSKALKYRAA